MKEGITLEEAVSIITGVTEPVRAVTEAALGEALGCILAADQIAAIDQPPFNRAPVDGYACRAADLAGASAEHPARLRVTAEIMAGDWLDRPVSPGTAVRIMTGAPIPQGCDCCVRQEDTDYGRQRVEIYRPLEAYQNYCYQGEDFKRGTCLLKKGSRITYVEQGIAASMGLSHLPVYRSPRIAMLISGDELLEPGMQLRPGKIYDSNRYLLLGRFQELGIKPVRVETVSDDPKAAAQSLKAAAEEADLIVTTGGVSVGAKDIFHEVLDLAGACKHFWRVLLKPGTPTIFSVIAGTPVVSLSGNPFGALVNFELLLRPLLAKLTGDGSPLPQRTGAVLQGEFPKPSRGRRFIRARYEDGLVTLPQGLHSSGVLGSMAGCNCLIDISPGTAKLSSGDRLTVVRL